jgi:hypothetical protein
MQRDAPSYPSLRTRTLCTLHATRGDVDTDAVLAAAAPRPYDITRVFAGRGDKTTLVTSKTTRTPRRMHVLYVAIPLRG